MDLNLALQNQLTDRQRRKDAKSNVDRLWSPKQIQNAFLESFEMVGGVPRLAIWANDPDNYEAFLKMLITLAPKGATALLGEKTGDVIQYVSNVPASPLNRVQSAKHEEAGIYGDNDSGGPNNRADLGDEQASGQGGICLDQDGRVLNLCEHGDEA